ncbi:TIGR04066 family peptide maturation system protein [Halodesulfovibrio aestuarii]|uniref:TIGR04066 family peptide maturation system protein n=1 Tax=Halodesulfovibrio aestuarii TaxID=126333 RepID=UPI003D355039
MAQKTLVYPFDRQFLPILRYADKVKQFDFTALVSLSGWGVCGLDAGVADKGSPLGMIVTNDFEKALEQCETVLFTQSDNHVSKDECLIPRMHLAIERKKNIACTIDLTETERDTLAQKCSEYGVTFQYLNKNIDHVQTAKQALRNEIIAQDIHAPVIMVFGLIEQVSKFETQLALEDFLATQGYKVSLVTSRGYGELVGGNAVPGFMFSKDFTEEEKILLFSNYVKYIEVTESPDVIIIGVPGGLLPATSRITNRFGITAFEMTQGIVPDASIICTLYNEYSEEYFNKLTPLLESRFNIDISSFLLDNITTTLSGYEQDDHFPLLMLDPEVLSPQSLTNIPTLVEFRQNREHLFMKIIDQLAANAEIEVC